MRRLLGLCLAVLMPLGMTACGSQTSSESAVTPSASQSATETAQWPRTITHEGGSTELKSAPQRIVSTSVVLTGSLLSLDAPVVGSAGTKPGIPGVDEVGFFSHWSQQAKDKHVESLYQNTELDLEAVAAADPDLIIIAASGRDSTADAQAELEKIAPVISINYNTEDWQTVLRKLGEATGTEAKAQANIADFAKLLEETKARIKPPADAVQAVVYSPKNDGLNFALPQGPHVEILKHLGFKYDTDVSALSEGRGGNRTDFAFLSVENSVANLTAHDVLFVGGEQKDVEAFKADPNYASLAPTQSGKLTALGASSFKLDYYSAIDMVKHIEQAYAK